MKVLIYALLGFVSFSSIADVVFKADPVIYKAMCIVISYGKDGSNFKQLGQMPVQLLDKKTVELYKDDDRVYTAMAETLSYNNKPAYDVFLVIADAKTGRRLSASLTEWYADSSQPPLVIAGTEEIGTSVQFDIQCMN